MGIAEEDNGDCGGDDCVSAWVNVVRMGDATCGFNKVIAGVVRMGIAAVMTGVRIDTDDWC